ncbi:hypothetical protein BD309DRAFT_966406 [Dichomitus squalens]|nr:hypothetical protein BD309DRAFT_966406 [Dichomitus squalens]
MTEPVTRKIALDHLLPLTTLTTTATLVRRLRSPVSSLTCLSVDMVCPVAAAVLTDISRTSGQTLLKSYAASLLPPMLSDLGIKRSLSEN